MQLRLQRSARAIFYLLSFSWLLPLVVRAQPDLGLQYGEYTGLGNRDIRLVIANAINILLGLIGAGLVVLLIVAGFRYMTSGGNPDTNKKALATITSAVIGIAIVLSAYIIARFVLQSLLSATTGVSAP